ncbi:MAG: FtsX-like permease family protein, partial [Candidatus Eremiobacterota bacterium]
SKDIIGKTVKLTFSSEGSGSRLMVIGILEKKGKSFGQDPDKQILIPLTTMKARFFDDKYIETIYIQGKNSETIDYAVDEIKKVILPLHKNNSSNFNIDSQEEMLNTISTTLTLFTCMLGGIAFISLIVGGIGIMNIMLVSVTERTREIGLRKAIGAKRRDILVQFLIESLVLGITGGIIGIGLGMLMAGFYTLIASYSNLGVMSKTIVSLQAIFISFSFSAMIGVFFGIYPARKAASLDPIEALRYE